MEMNEVVVVTHPLVQHKLTIMRKTETSTVKFRTLMHEVSMLLAYEVTRDLELEFQTKTTEGDHYDDDTRLYEEASAGDFSFYPEEKVAYVSTRKGRRTPTKRDALLRPSEVDILAELIKFREQQKALGRHRKTNAKNVPRMAWDGSVSIIRDTRSR